MVFVALVGFAVVMTAGIVYGFFFSNEPFRPEANVPHWESADSNAHSETASTVFDVSDIGYARQKFWND